jgi:serine O-acetyltransferase
MNGFESSLRITAPVDVDAVWSGISAQARDVAIDEPAMSATMRRLILPHATFADALASLLSYHLGADPDSHGSLRTTFAAGYAAHPSLVQHAVSDLGAIVERDPACGGTLPAFLYYKGFHALQTHRLNHELWLGGQKQTALYVQHRGSLSFQVDIHPAAVIGARVFIDHATGIVIGETAVVGDDVSILQGVTLGGTGKETGDRHPKIGSGVLLSAGAIVLGNIRVGDCAKVAAGSVVLADVPPSCTVAGIPAKIVSKDRDTVPALTMKQEIDTEHA